MRRSAALKYSGRTRVVRLPREPGLVGAALVEGGHIGIEPGDDLDDVEALRAAVGGEGLEIVGPFEPLRQGPSTRCRPARRTGVPSA